MFLQKAPLTKQIWIASSVLLYSVSCGMVTGCGESPSDATPWREPPSLHTSFLGLLIAALLMHRYGRRTAFIVTIFSTVIAWLTIFADNTIATTVGRTLGDFTKSTGVVLKAIIIGEYTSPRCRGVFVTLASGFLGFGKLTAYYLGDPITIAKFALPSSIFALIISCKWPESPAWLASRQRYEECRKSFNWLRGTMNERELEKVIQKQKEDATKIRKKMGVLYLINKYTGKHFIKPTVLILFASIALEASGISILKAHGSQIVGDIVGKSSSSYVLYMNVIFTMSILFSSALVKILKRKTLFLFSGFFSVVILFLLSLALFLRSNNVPVLPWMPISMLIVYLISINLGCTVMFLMWCGELFPFEHKSVGLLISGLLLNIGSYISLYTTPYIIIGLKLYGLFGLLVIVLSLSLLTLFFIAPETKDKTLLEIECYFINGDFESEGEDEVTCICR